MPNHKSPAQTTTKTIGASLEQRGVSRAAFLKFCTSMAGVLALPARYADEIAQGLAAASRLPVIWLEFSDCTGDSESFLRASPRPDPIQSGVTDPSITDLLLDFISVEYHETIMVASGAAAEKSLTDVMALYPGQYVCIVEGAIPLGAGGAYCTIRGRTALSIAQEVCTQAKANLALGSCAYDGGLVAAAPNPTGAVGLGAAVPNAPQLLNMPGCPSNVVNSVASLVYLLAFNQWPPADSKKRPYFAYGEEIHEDCEREDHYEANRFVLAWGDQGHRNGWCLYRMGCKGPRTRSNCGKVRWNQGVNWPVRSGHGCIGCTADHFWDNLPPVYDVVPD